jgi:hypothetical protein
MRTGKPKKAGGSSPEKDHTKSMIAQRQLLALLNRFR